MSPVSRGSRHLHRIPAGQEDQVPPGQYVTDGFPVPSAGPTPHTPLEQRTFSITQGGQSRKPWTWNVHAVPAAQGVGRWQASIIDEGLRGRRARVRQQAFGVPGDHLCPAAGGPGDWAGRLP